MNNKVNHSKISGRLHWYHWLVVASSLLLTFGAWFVTHNQVKAKNKSRFDFQVNEIIELVTERMETYEATLWSGVATMNTMPERVERSDWRTFADNLAIGSLYPGINGIGVAHYVPPDELGQYLSWQRQEMPDFHIHPALEGNEYWPITYIEPQDINIKAVGLNMAHEVNRFTAAKAARDSGEAQITGPIILVQDAKKTPGFLFYVPWYKNRSAPEQGQRKSQFLGLVYAAFIVENLMDGTLENTNRQVNFSIFDEGHLLYNELNQNSVDYDSKPMFSTFRQVSAYGRDWVFNVQSTKLFRVQNSSQKPMLILVAGLTIDALLLALFMVLARSNRQAVSYAEAATEDLQTQKITLSNTLSQLDGTMNAMMDGIIVMDARGHVKITNAATEKMLGLSKRELLGCKIHRFLPEAQAADYRHIFTVTTHLNLDDGLLHKEHRLTLIKADGSFFPVRLNISVGENENGAYYTWIIHDLSAFDATRSQLEKSERLLKITMYQSATPMAILDNDGRFIDANTALSEWLGYRFKELTQLRIDDICCTESSQLNPATEMIRELTEGKASASIQCQYKTLAGDPVWGIATATRLYLDQTGDIDSLVFIAQFTNIQALKELESKLAEQNHHLLEINEELNQFTYIASHDLKEPLRTMRTFTSYLLNDLEDENWNRVNEDVALISSAAERMTCLVDDLLALSRAGNLKIQTKAVSSHDIFAEVVNNLQNSIEEANAHIEIMGEAIAFDIDKRLIVQALQNLTSNALKFRSPERKPYLLLSSHLSENNDGFGTIKIKDNGIGIEEKYHKDIFLAFKRLHGMGEYDGSGIGLSIVKKVVDRHDGEVTLNSTPGGGSCFCLKLPLAAQVARYKTLKVGAI